METLQVKGDTLPDFSSLTIEGERVLLVPINDVFAAEIFREFDSTITRYMMPKPADNISEVTAFISSSQVGMRQRQELVFVIMDRSTMTFLGVCCCTGKKTPDTPELGIWLKKSAHGQKLGLESIATLVKWVMKNLHFKYLLYPVDRANVASRKIPEMLGGKVFAERQVESMSDLIIDEVTYRIKKTIA